MELRNHCAYNQTRECFLGLEVAEADVRYMGRDDLAARLALRSGEGLWVVPFRGIPAVRVEIVLDLIYLDAQCRVIEVAESSLVVRKIPAHPRAASALLLPSHTIDSSQTQSGDQLVICMAGEMERQLELLYQNGGKGITVESAAILRETPLWSGGPGLLELENRSGSRQARPLHEMTLSEPGKRNFRPPRNWLERWWSPDPRRAPREPAHGVAAYYWTGAMPVPHSVRDISSTGLYLVTEERWYPGTLVLMTLKRTGSAEQAEERSIFVHSRAVRWGDDGVGLQFVLPDGGDPILKEKLIENAADKKALSRFLKPPSKRRERS